MKNANPLTPRQIDCLHLAALGKTSAQIGHELKISARTVDDYVADACRRLSVHNRTQAVVKATVEGWL